MHNRARKLRKLAIKGSGEPFFWFEEPLLKFEQV